MTGVQLSPDAAYRSPVSSTQAVTVAMPPSSVRPLLSTFNTCLAETRTSSYRQHVSLAPNRSWNAKHAGFGSNRESSER